MLKRILRRGVATVAASMLMISLAVLTASQPQAVAAPTDSAPPKWVTSVLPDYAGNITSKDSWVLYSRSDTGYNFFPLKNWNTPHDRRLKLSGFPKEATGDFISSMSFVAKNTSGEAKRYPLFSGFSFYAPKADGSFDMDIAIKHSNKPSVADLPAGNVEGYLVYRGNRREYVTNKVTIVNSLKPAEDRNNSVVLPGDCLPGWLRGAAQQTICNVPLTFKDELDELVITPDKGDLAKLGAAESGKITGFPASLNGVEITQYYFVAITEAGFAEHFHITSGVGNYQKIKNGSLTLPSDTVIRRNFDSLPGGHFTGYLKLSSNDNKAYLVPIIIDNQLKKPTQPPVPMTKLVPAIAAPSIPAPPQWATSVVPNFAGSVRVEDNWTLYSRSDNGYNFFPLKTWNTPHDRRLKLSGFPKEATGDYISSMSFVAKNTSGEAKRYPLFSGYSFYAPKADGTFDMNIAIKHSNKPSVADLPAGNNEGYLVYRGDSKKEYMTNKVTIVNTLKPAEDRNNSVVLPGDCLPGWLRGAAQQTICNVPLTINDELVITPDQGSLVKLAPTGSGKITGFPASLNGVEITQYYFVAITEAGFAEHFHITSGVGNYQKIKNGSLTLASDTVIRRHFNSLPGGRFTGYLKLSSNDNKAYLVPIIIDNQLKKPTQPPVPMTKLVPAIGGPAKPAPAEVTNPLTPAKPAPMEVAKPLTPAKPLPPVTPAPTVKPAPTETAKPAPSAKKLRPLPPSTGV